MKLGNVKEKLESGINPVVINFVKEENCKVFTIFFKQGMVLTDHKTNRPAILYVLTGKVQFKTADQMEEVGCFEEIDIPVGVIHQVVCLEEATCLLIQK